VDADRSLPLDPFVGKHPHRRPPAGAGIQCDRRQRSPPYVRSEVGGHLPEITSGPKRCCSRRSRLAALTTASQDRRSSCGVTSSPSGRWLRRASGLPCYWYCRRNHRSCLRRCRVLVASNARAATDPLQSAVPWLVLAAGTAGGVVAGWFVAAFVVSRAPGKLRCPRCGTANDRQTQSCVACGLSFD
jgi:hypothetical protein